jgi:23S rRNA pseudouridine1911/1915/1917 synthase
MIMEPKIIYENSNYLVISKPIGIAVHPGADRTSYTICDWLCSKYPQITTLPWKSRSRIGIVHRLDKDTSGIMILAKNPETLDHFQNQFKKRKVGKFYLALVLGKPKQEQKTIYGFISSSPKNRKAQKVQLIDFGLDERERKNTGTKYHVKEKYSFDKKDITLLDVEIFTGRKHQIRAHLKYEGYPILGDTLYTTKPARKLSQKLDLNRQFLHAYRIKIVDPAGKQVMFEDNLPRDLKQVLDKLNQSKNVV